MGSVNSLPVVSQVKSLVQAIGGDIEGARQTQEDFSQECPIISQMRSLTESVVLDDNAAARRTQIKFVKGLNDLTDGVPGVGHIKGTIHYVCGDTQGGDRAMKSASRTTGVIGGGIVGALVGGPAGAIAGGMAGGQILDGITTGVDSLVHEEYRPNGSWAGMHRIITGKADIGEGFDTLVGLGADALAGYGCDGAIKSLKSTKISKSKNQKLRLLQQSKL